MEKEKTIKKIITQEDVKSFIEGRNPFERIVNITYHYRDNFVNIFYRDEQDRKCVKHEDFYPFLWATQSACNRLCHGNRKQVSELLRKYSIGIKKLNNTNSIGEVRHEFDDGYMFQFYAEKPMSYGDFLMFFTKCENPVYSKRDKQGKEMSRSNEEERQYLVATAVEQHMIRTGERFFKGYDDYNDVLRLTFDLETEGLDAKKDRIKLNGIRFNRETVVNGKKCPRFEKTFKIEGETEAEKDKSELKIIDTMFSIIYTYNPDIITAHNGENFDWNFIIIRCQMLGTSIENMSSKYFNGESIHKEQRETILKLGGEIEMFYRTIVPNVIVTDSLHAVRRAQATDSNFLKADLKYSTKYLHLNKKNRVYAPGDEIDKILVDKTNKYAFNNTDGDWYLYDETLPDSNVPFKKGKNGDNSFIIYSRNKLYDGYEIATGEYIINRYLLDDLWECDNVEYSLNGTEFVLCKLLPVHFSKCCTMGTAGQWKSLMMAWSYENNLAIPKAVNTGSFTGGLSRLMCTGYVNNIIKLDYNSLYPSIILTWGISDTTDLTMVMLYMLEFILTTRETYKGLKKKAEKAVSAFEMDINNGRILTEQEKMDYSLQQRDFKVFDGRQASVKKLGNSFFGFFGSNNGAVAPWKSPKCAEQTTCIGRQCLRLMISHFKQLGYEPIVGDTDGFNFQLPDSSKYRYTKEHPYIGKGSNREVKLGVKYTGYEADVAEFNDLYMNKVYSEYGVQKMGLGIDEVVSSTINFSRKNYADYFPDKDFPDDVKMVGNTIKSKKMPEYISKFLGKGIRLLLQGNGQSFLNEYYNYIEKIYNYDIPLRDIASKGKIKKSLNEYLQDVKKITKAGRPKSRQAWYELALRDKLKVDNGDTIYYINTGKSKSHPDVKKIKHYYDETSGERVEITKNIEKEYKLYKKGVNSNICITKDEWIIKEYPNAYSTDEVIMNCGLVPREIINNENDTFCEDVGIEYNVPKYIEQFNNRITPLLVCFSKLIRDQILVNNPDNNPYFTEEQCKLVSGEPNKSSDQDTYEQLMTMEDKEIKFWTKYNLIPPFVEECRMGKWENIVTDYNNRMEQERDKGISKERENFDEILDNLSIEELENFIDECEVPNRLSRDYSFNVDKMEFYSKKYPDVIISSATNIVDYLNIRLETDVND